MSPFSRTRYSLMASRLPGAFSRTPPAPLAAGPLARVLIQIAVAGIAVLSRALPAAYAQALQNARKGGVTADEGGEGSGSGMFARKAISNEEAMQVLNVNGEQIESDPEIVQKQFDRYFKANDVSKGGSFYLQSKVYRAKEQLDLYVKEKRREEEGEEGAKGEEETEKKDQ